jgi:hypothetical protein
LTYSDVSRNELFDAKGKVKNDVYDANRSSELES